MTPSPCPVPSAPRLSWWGRLALRGYNLWHYHTWSRCTHVWLLYLTEEGLAAWRCRICDVRHRL